MTLVGADFAAGGPGGGTACAIVFDGVGAVFGTGGAALELAGTFGTAYVVATGALAFGPKKLCKQPAAPVGVSPGSMLITTDLLGAAAAAFSICFLLVFAIMPARELY